MDNLPETIIVNKSSLNIYQRINKIMIDVEYVQKDTAISGGGANYKAVSHDQVVSVLRRSMVNHGVVVVPRQISGEFIIKRDLTLTPPVKMGLYTGSYDIDFVNIDVDHCSDKVTVSVQAHANDNGDKAPGKALSYAVKSAMLKVFSLETGENDESREEQRDINLISTTQIDQLLPLLCDESGNYTEKGEKVCRAFKFNNLSEIKSKKFNEILRFAS